MARNSGYDREEAEALHAMAKGANTALEGLLSLDNVISRKKSEAIVKNNALRNKYALENWNAQFDLSLKTILKLVTVFSNTNRHPQFSSIKKQISDLLSKD